VNDRREGGSDRLREGAQGTPGRAVLVKTYATGMLKDIIDLSGTVKMWRPPPDRCSGWSWARQGPGQAGSASSRSSPTARASSGTTTPHTQFTSLATEPNAMESAEHVPRAESSRLVLRHALHDGADAVPEPDKTGINNFNGEVLRRGRGDARPKDRNRRGASA